VLVSAKLSLQPRVWKAAFRGLLIGGFPGWMSCAAFGSHQRVAKVPSGRSSGVLLATIRPGSRHVNSMQPVQMRLPSTDRPQRLCVACMLTAFAALVMLVLAYVPW
jgi:hypothetical protein